MNLHPVFHFDNALKHHFISAHTVFLELFTALRFQLRKGLVNMFQVERLGQKVALFVNVQDVRTQCPERGPG